MKDTIEWLNAIGADATLRYADPATLQAVLEQAQASSALTDAVVFADPKRLAGELGDKLMESPQMPQSPGHEEEPEQEDEDDAASPPSLH